MGQIYKNLTRDTLIYGIGSILSKGIAFLLLPIYTRIFTTTEYGSLEVVLVVNTLFAAILNMGMDSALSYYFVEAKKINQERAAQVVTSILQWRMIWGIFCCFIIGTLSPLISYYLFDGAINRNIFTISIFSVFCMQIMMLSAELLRLLFRPWGYVFLSVCYGLLSALLSVIFVYYLKFGIFSVFLGSTLAALPLCLIGFHRIKKYLDFSGFHFHQWLKFLKFGTPLMPAGMIFGLMGASDRFFLQYYEGITTVGIFAVGAKLAMIMNLLVDTFRQAWWPFALDSIRREDGKSIFKTVARFYIGLCCIMVILLTYFSKTVVAILAGTQYVDAWEVVGILSGQPVIYGFLLIGSIGIIRMEKTYLNVPLMLLALISGVFLNWLLVPQLGMYGASIATLLSYLIWCLLSLIVSQRLWRIDFDYHIMILQLSLTYSFVFLFISFSNGDYSFRWSIIVLVLTLILGFSLFDNKSRRSLLSKYIQRQSEETE